MKLLVSKHPYCCYVSIGWVKVELVLQLKVDCLNVGPVCDLIIYHNPIKHEFNIFCKINVKVLQNRKRPVFSSPIF